MTKEYRLNTRIKKTLRDDLKEIAAEDFEGNFSMVVRRALDLGLRVLRLRRGKTQPAEPQDPSS